MVCRELSVELKLLMPKIKLSKDCLWRDGGSHNIKLANVRPEFKFNTRPHLQGGVWFPPCPGGTIVLNINCWTRHIWERTVENSQSISCCRVSTGRVSTIAVSTRLSHQRSWNFWGVKISNKNCYRCKVRRTRLTLTSILATRLCQATKSRDGTRSSETSPLLLGLQRVLRTQTFQGFWDFKNFLVLQYLHASEKEPSKVIKENFSKFVVKTFSEKKCLLHLWTVGKYQLTIADCKRSIRTFNVHSHTLFCVYEKLHNM